MYPAGGLPAPLAAYRAYDSPAGRSFIRTADQSVLAAVGYTQASRVMPDDSRSRALSATVTQLLVPLNDRALPYFPAVTQVAPEIAPVSPLPAASAAAAPAPSSNPYAATKAGTARS